MKSTTTKWSLAALVVAVVAVLTASPVAAESSLDEELEEYWATERDMEVIKQRLYERDGRFGLGLYAGLITTEPFFHYYPVGANAKLFFSNNFGLEISGSYMSGPLTRNTELTDFLEADRGQAGFDRDADTADRFLWRTNALAVWSPFYGKIAALQQKLLHFDLNLGAGFGAVGVERPAADRDPVRTSTTATPEFVLGVGAHFYIDQNVLIRFDGRGFVHQGPEFTTEVPAEGGSETYQDSFHERLNFASEFQFGVSYLF